ncbi:MAG: SPOR domain-containing protein [Gammaproteobacteria bacterium]|nr:SPOR domain-containing protein [Gammaproteobacteria bacterium]
MEQGRLKQRLLGAIVLVALAVIFIPMLLSGGRDVEIPVFGSNVPERSTEIKNIKHIDISDSRNAEVKPVNPARIPVAPGVTEPKVVKEEKANVIFETITGLTKEEKKPAIKQTVWAVQVGSFSKRSNALGLKEKLRKKKMHAFIERIMKDNKATYRVRVGPEISREKAEALKQKLKKEFKLTGLVVKHP